MATYRAISSTEIDADSPLTVQLAAAWTNNVLAIIENDATAPEIDGGAIAANTLNGSALADDSVAQSKLESIVTGTVSKSSGPDTYTISPGDALDGTGGSAYWFAIGVTDDAGASNENAGVVGMVVRYFDDGGSGQWRGVVLDSWTGDGTDDSGTTSVTVSGGDIVVTVANHDGGASARYTLVRADA